MNKNERIEINDKRKEILLCTYGTLRLGHGNYHAYLEGASEHLGTFQTEPKFTMYGKNAGFPVVVDRGSTSIEYDLFRVTDNSVLRGVHGLEGFRGIKGDPSNWYDITEIETPFGTAYMYVMHKDLRPDSIIESGNWNNR